MAEIQEKVIFQFKIGGKEFAEMFEKKFNRRPTQDDYDRCCHQFACNEENGRSNVEEIWLLLYEDFKRALSDIGTIDEDDEEESDDDKKSR